MLVRHRHRVVKQTYQPIDNRRDMTCHELKRRGHIEAEPSHLRAELIAVHRPFPAKDGNQQRDDEHDDVSVRFK